MTNINIVHVAVAVIKNSHGQYFIAKRSQETHQGGLWEFPGGKVENNESVQDALKRELLEEVGIKVNNSTPLIKIHHDYNDKRVLLDVWNITEFSGIAFGKEGQETKWVDKCDLAKYNFPAANLPIINAIHLPDKYMITGDFRDEKELLLRVRSGLKNGINLIQFRAHHLSELSYFNYAEKLYKVCEKENATLLLNTSLKKYNKHNAYCFSHGLHLTAKELSFFSFSAIKSDILVSSSIHNQNELRLAEKNKVDFVVLSPVNATLTHPNAVPLGWNNFKSIAEKANIPIYALGGMKEEDIITAKNFGGHGISAIGNFWGE